MNGKYYFLSGTKAEICLGHQNRRVSPKLEVPVREKGDGDTRQD